MPCPAPWCRHSSAFGPAWDADTRSGNGDGADRELGYPPRMKTRAEAEALLFDHVYGGAEAVGRLLGEHVGFLIEALKPFAGEIGL